MKKRIALFFLAAVLLFAPSCSLGGQQATVNYRNPETGKLQISLSQTILTQEGDFADGPTNLYFEAFHNNLQFISYTADPSPTEGFSPTKYIIYDIKTKKSIEAEGEYHYHIYSGEFVVMKGRYLYMWSATTLENDESAVSLLRADSKENKHELIESRKEEISPLVGMNALNENQFLSVTTTWLTDNSIVKKVEKHDIRTGKSETIIAEEYYNDGNKESGRALNSVCAVDNTIYTISREKNDGSYKYYLSVYDENGKLLSRTEEPELANVYSGAYLGELNVVGDYFIVKRDGAPLHSKVFKKEADGLRLYLPNTTNPIFAWGLASNYKSEALPYLYYMRRSYAAQGEEMNDETAIWAFNTKTGESTEIDVLFDREYPYLDVIWMDTLGNLTLQFRPTDEMGTDEYQKLRIYFVSAAELKKVIESPAPAE